jgi:streptogramin lyase
MSRITRLSVLSLATGLVVFFGPTFEQIAPAAGYAAPGDVLLTGTIKSASGEKMEGVTVSARALGATFTTSVFSDLNGEFYFPRLESGRYKVWAQAVGYEGVRLDVDLASTVQRQAFVMKPIKDFALQLRGDEWVASLPEATYQDKKMKEVFRMSCGGCHNQNMAMKDRLDEKGWKNIIDLMSRIATSGYGSSEDAVPNPLFQYYRDDLAAYLAKVRGPGPSTAKLTARPRPRGDETLVVIREYDTVQPGTGLPLFDDGSDWSLGAPSKLDIKNHHSIDGTIDFDGNVWFSDDLNRNPYRSVGKIDWKTGKVTNYKVPRADGSGMAVNVHDVITDHEGNIWFGAEGKLARIDGAGKMDLFSPPKELGRGAGGMTAVDGKGRIWSGAGDGAIMFDPKTQTWAGYKNPATQKELGITGTYGMAGDREGNGWWAQYAIDVMVKADGQSPGKTEAVKVPRANNPAWELFTGDDRKIFEMLGGAEHHGRGVPDQFAIRKPGAGPGPTDAVWGPSWFNDALVKVDIHTHKSTVYPYPWRDGGSYQAVVDNEGMVWVVFTNGDYVGKFNPRTERWTRYDLPTLGTEAHGLQVVTVNKRTQVTAPYWAAGKTAKLEFRTRQELQALKVEAQGSSRGQ